jgi:hypothetical protein
MEELTQVEQATLAAYISTDGFQILNEKIMKSEVLKFNTALLNAKQPEDVIRLHNLATAAAKFYQGVLDRINAEIYAYTNTPRPTDVPVDTTEGVLDFGTTEE